jgi:hypothetical protein
MPKDDFINAIESKLKDFTIHFYFQDQNVFLPLDTEKSGFCLVVARKRSRDGL